MKFSGSLIQGLLLDVFTEVFVSKEIGASVVFSLYIFLVVVILELFALTHTL